MTDDDLRGFVLGGLAATRDSIEHILAIQKRMMDVVSRHAFAPADDGNPESSPADMQELVTALQSDDLIRQTHENLLHALAVMARALEEGRRPDDGVAGRSPRRQRWTRELLDSVLMEDLRQRFAAKLDRPDGN